MRFLGRSLVGIVLVAVTLGLLAWAGQMVTTAFQKDDGTENRRERRARLPLVTVLMAEAGPQTPILQSFGKIESARSLELRSASSGRVIKLHPEMRTGGQVKAGDRLVEIDPTKARTALERSRADLTDARAEQRDANRALALAKDELVAAQDQQELRNRTLTRQQGLIDRGVGTEANLEAAELAAAAARQSVLSRRTSIAQIEARIDQASTRILRAQLSVDEAARALADTRIDAAFDGTLGQVSLVQGGLVTTNEKLAVLLDPGALEVSVRLSTAQYARLLDAQGQLRDMPIQVTLQVDGIPLTSAGRVSRESADVGDGQTGRLIFATLERPQGFKPGDFVLVEIEEPVLPDAVKLPAAALSGSNEVLVLGPEDQLQALPVEILRRQGDDVLVRAAALAGREVITERGPQLGAGIRVKPNRPNAKTSQLQPPTPDLVELSQEQRTRLMAFVEGSKRMPPDAKERVLKQLRADKVPARVVQRLEQRMGG